MCHEDHMEANEALRICCACGGGIKAVPGNGSPNKTASAGLFYSAVIVACVLFMVGFAFLTTRKSGGRSFSKLDHLSERLSVNYNEDYNEEGDDGFALKSLARVAYDSDDDDDEEDLIFRKG